MKKLALLLTLIPSIAFAQSELLISAGISTNTAADEYPNTSTMLLPAMSVQYNRGKALYYGGSLDYLQVKFKDQPGTTGKITVIEHLIRHGIGLAAHGGYKLNRGNHTIVADLSAGAVFSMGGEKNYQGFFGTGQEVTLDWYFDNGIIFKGGLSLGYRHKVTQRLSLGATAGGYVLSGGYSNYGGDNTKVGDQLFYFPVMLTAGIAL